MVEAMLTAEWREKVTVDERSIYKSDSSLSDWRLAQHFTDSCNFINLT